MIVLCKWCSVFLGSVYAFHSYYAMWPWLCASIGFVGKNRAEQKIHSDCDTSDE